MKELEETGIPGAGAPEQIVLICRKCMFSLHLSLNSVKSCSAAARWETLIGSIWCILDGSTHSHTQWPPLPFLLLVPTASLPSFPKQIPNHSITKIIILTLYEDECRFTSERSLWARSCCGPVWLFVSITHYLDIQLFLCFNKDDLSLISCYKMIYKRSLSAFNNNS